jgi:hypothetical protein
VNRRRKGDKPFGWVIYRREDAAPVARSKFGYADEVTAWNAAATALTGLEAKLTKQQT